VIENTDVLNELQTLLREYNVVFVGDKGIDRAYENFLSKYGMKRKKPTKEQAIIIAQLSYGGS